MISSTVVRNAQLQALASQIDGGHSAATLSLYAGVAPAGVGAITDQSLLVALPMDYPCANKIEYGVLTFGAVQEQMITGTGTVGFARICDSAGVPICDLTVGLSNSGADLVLPTVSLMAGAYLRLTGVTISGA